MGIREGQIGRVKKHLLSGERVLDIAFPSRLSLVKWYSAAFGLLIISILSYRIPVTFLPLTGFMLAAFIGAALLLVLYAELRRRYEFLAITNLRVLHVKGLIARRFTDVVIDRISDMTYAQGLIGVVFNHGSISINTPGSPDAKIVMHGVLYPEKRKQLIDSIIHMHHEGAPRNVYAARKQ